jgi:hypothetical protein
MRSTSCLLAALLGCASSPPPSLARTTLTLLDPQPAVGRPIRLRLALTNDSPSILHFDHLGNGGFEVLGPDGRNVPHILGPRQTLSRMRDLAPGQTMDVDDLHLDSAYLIDRPGRYSVRFNGDGLWLGAAPLTFASFRESLAQPASNTVRFDVLPGAVSEKHRLARGLLEILPPLWELGMERGTQAEEDERIALIRIKSGFKHDTIYLTIVIAGKQPQGKMRPIGKRGERTVYLEDNPKAEAAWPGHEARIVQAIAK